MGWYSPTPWNSPLLPFWRQGLRIGKIPEAIQYSACFSNLLSFFYFSPLWFMTRILFFTFSFLTELFNATLSWDIFGSIAGLISYGTFKVINRAKAHLLSETHPMNSFLRPQENDNIMLINSYVINRSKICVFLGNWQNIHYYILSVLHETKEICYYHPHLAVWIN